MRVGIIGRGFGERVVAKAFDSLEGCQVIDVVTPRDAAAVTALCRRDDIDLVSVHSPPFAHVDNVRQALEAGKAVLCDKPFGRNADEAATMCALAREAGVLGFVNFGGRYGSGRGRLRQLILDGAIGRPEHLAARVTMSSTRVPVRPYGWLFDKELGGGWLAALGSHLLDFTRWTFGEVTEAHGQLRTSVTERPDGDGTLHRCTADDGFTVMLRTERGVTATIDSTSAALATLASTMVVTGTDGVLEMEGERIVLHDESGSSELFTPDAAASRALLGMHTWVGIIRDAVHGGAVPDDAPRFADGLACAQIMDRLRV